MESVQSGVIIFGIVVTYLIVTTAVGAWSVKYSKDTNSFMSAKSQMGTYLISVLLVSEFVAAASTLGTAQKAFEKGISASWVFISIGLGFLLYSFLLAGKYKDTKEYTISGIISQRYGQWGAPDCVRHHDLRADYGQRSGLYGRRRGSGHAAQYSHYRGRVDHGDGGNYLRRNGWHPRRRLR